jgi:hypothetical protein
VSGVTRRASSSFGFALLSKPLGRSFATMITERSGVGNFPRKWGVGRGLPSSRFTQRSDAYPTPHFLEGNDSPFLLTPNAPDDNAVGNFRTPHFLTPHSLRWNGEWGNSPLRCHRSLRRHFVVMGSLRPKGLLHSPMTTEWGIFLENGE